MDQNNQFGARHMIQSVLQNFNKAYPVAVAFLILISIIWQLGFWSVFEVNPFEFFTLSSIISSTLQNLIASLFYVICSFIAYLVSRYYLSKSSMLAILFILPLSIIVVVASIFSGYVKTHFEYSTVTIVFAIILASGIGYEPAKEISSRDNNLKRLYLFSSLVAFAGSVYIQGYQKAGDIIKMKKFTIVTVEIHTGEKSQIFQKIHLGVIGDFIFFTDLDLSKRITCVPLDDVKKLEYN